MAKAVNHHGFCFMKCTPSRALHPLSQSLQLRYNAQTCRFTGSLQSQKSKTRQYTSSHSNLSSGTTEIPSKHTASDESCSPRLVASSKRASGDVGESPRPRNDDASRSSVVELTRNSLIDSVKEQMRTVPHPVAIVTAKNPKRDGQWAGCTISSFNTVTMSPVPIVSFNIKTDSSTLAAIKASNYFAVAFPAATPEGRYLATRFATSSLNPFTHENGSRLPYVQPEGYFSYKRMGKSIPVQARRQLFPPQLSYWPESRTQDAVIWSMLCAYRENSGHLVVGDHQIVVGEVLAILSPETRRPKAAAISEPENIVAQRPGCLTYLNRKYNVDSTIQPVEEFKMQTQTDVRKLQAKRKQETSIEN